ncbi:TetR/AcrR family transcriptional regulator [Actinomadura algeriensis]|uniref:AcrR family transcriptional regulator n=1 Tax=Actinomadura algeriensis TaxID=1679523 RepID=A0ABR9JXS4_9ACTN|nr:TetR family transcriptional regulator [Actinomadura algeriensis]MBE1535370.1 AcrR family transcriptional regulator [Actinomadura algeriensis]
MNLTERRKAATELEIARAAASLFAERGSGGTTVEAIADRAGLSLRTFYRYFPTKQDAVAPLLSIGAQRWLDLLAAAPRDVPAAGALESAAARALAAPDAATAESYGWTRGLLRAADDDPALRAVWLRVNDESERRLARILTDRTDGADGADPLEAAVAAAAATAAIRIAVETWARGDAGPTGPGSPADLAVRCMRELTAGLRASARP